VLQLLHQMLTLLAALEGDLGFVHDDMRLENIMEGWPGPGQQQHKQQQEKQEGEEQKPQHQKEHQQHQGQQQQDQEPKQQDHQQQQDQEQKEHNRQQQQQQQQEEEEEEAGAEDCVFRLFDFGLSNINPDIFSMGPQAGGSRQDRKRVIQQLEKQGKME
jgi:Mg-chelatase subunit ChlI